VSTGPQGGRASISIRAPADALWALITDVTRTGEWSPESTGGVWLDEATGAAVGARFRGSNRRGRTKWSTTCEVTAAEPGREFAFVTGRPSKPETAWRYVLEPASDGTTLLTESFELVKPLGAVSNFVTRVTTGVKDRRADLEDNVRASLAKIKEIAEA
jgi:uncharacterized protein YndB with AHSA1/START domain